MLTYIVGIHGTQILLKSNLLKILWVLAWMPCYYDGHVPILLILKIFWLFLIFILFFSGLGMNTLQLNSETFFFLFLIKKSIFSFFQKGKRFIFEQILLLY